MTITEITELKEWFKTNKQDFSPPKKMQDVYFFFHCIGDPLDSFWIECESCDELTFVYNTFYELAA